jgi:hypothetical protein
VRHWVSSRAKSRQVNVQAGSKYDLIVLTYQSEATSLERQTRVGFGFPSSVRSESLNSSTASVGSKGNNGVKGRVLFVCR